MAQRDIHDQIGGGFIINGTLNPDVRTPVNISSEEDEPKTKSCRYQEIELSSEDEDKDEDEDEIQLVTIRPKSKSRLITKSVTVGEKEEFLNLEEKTGYIKVGKSKSS